ncbi:MAG: thiolase domain-containing protein, partial [Hydrogenophaga sp.]|nr:thiolase domain-containing protein [Hydrogenophaga sp.]
MSLQGKAYIAGIYEHPLRRADSHSTAQLHAEVALGALEDAGLSLDDVDGYFCGADAPGLGGLTMAEYIGLNKLQHTDTTESGGSAYLLHVSHAAQAIATGRCRVALVTMADRPLAAAAGTALAGVDRNTMPNLPFQAAVPPQPMYGYAMVARRHMHEFGTTPEQLAWVRVAASHHAQHNPHAVHRDVVSVDDVLRSPMVANPLHRLDCCVMTDGGGAVVVVHPDIARQLRRPLVKLIGAGEAVKHPGAGRIDLSYSAARSSGAKAFQDAGIAPADIGYVSLYDSFT